MFTRFQLTSLQLAGLFTLFIFGFILLAVADLLIYERLQKLALFYSTRQFLTHAFVGLGLILAGAALFYRLYRLRKAGRSSPLFALGPLAVCCGLVAAAASVDFFFARLTLGGIALIVLAFSLTGIASSNWPARILRGLAWAAAWIVFPVATLEAYLLSRNLHAYAGVSASTGIIDFTDTLAIGERGNPGQLQPGLDAPLILGNGSTGRIRTNAHGFRAERELIVPKPEGEFRILLLGDSFSVGYRADQDEYAAAVAQRRLQRKLDRDVQIYSAMTVDQHGLKAFLRKYSRLVRDADLIVHGVCLGNDLGTSLHKNGLDQTKTPLARVPSAFLDRANFDSNVPADPSDLIKGVRRTSRIVSSVRAVLLPTPIWSGRARFFGSASLWIPQNNLGLFIKDETLQAPYYATFERNLVDAHKLIGDTPLRVVLFPQRGQQSEAEWEAQVAYDGLRRDGFDLDRPNRLIGEMCENHGWNCLDLLPTFREHGHRLLHLPYDMHWNAAGNEVAGVAIAEYLEPLIREAAASASVSKQPSLVKSE